MNLLKVLSLSLLGVMTVAVRDSDKMDVHIVRKYDRKKISRTHKATDSAISESGASHVRVESVESLSRARSRRSVAESATVGTLSSPDVIVNEQDNQDGRVLKTVNTWNGLGASGYAPSDACGAVGPSHYFQVVNNRYAIYSKTGIMLSGPHEGNDMFAAYSGTTDGAMACRTATHGDPTVQYDQMADRWIFTEFAWLAANDDTGPWFQCVAVSQTSDPMGSYYYYAFEGRDGSNNPVFPDYGKIAIWPDAYYITYVLFSSVYEGPQVCGYNRANMLVGGDADPYCIALGSSHDILFAGDLDGNYANPSTTIGNTNYITALSTAPTNQILVYKMSYTDRTFTGPTVLTIPTWSPICNWYQRNCIAQPGTPDTLDGLDDRFMYRTAFRMIGSQESLLLMHSVRGAAFGTAVTRWYELRTLSTVPTLYQTGTVEPDTTTSRWMGSMAMNKDGEIAIGYSVSGPSVYPGVRVSGRSSSDAAGTVGTEYTLINGGGSQVSTANRWGDYSCMQVDPVDDTRFWYTQQYIATTGSFNWQSIISGFHFNDIGSPTPAPTTAAPTISPAPTVVVTSAPTLEPDQFYLSGLDPLEVTYWMRVSGGNGYCGTFEAMGAVTSVTVDLNFGGQVGNVEWASDMAVGLFDPLGNRVQIGGYDLEYTAVTHTYNFPSSWDSTAAGSYSATINISSANAAGTGTWEVCVANFYAAGGSVLYDGTVVFNYLVHSDITTTVAPTQVPSHAPTKAEFNHELYGRLNITGYYGTKGATLVTNTNVENCATAIKGFRIKMPEGLIRQDGHVLNGMSHVFLRTSGDTYLSEWYSDYTLAYNGHTVSHSQNLFESSGVQVSVSPVPKVVGTGYMVAKPHFEYAYQFQLDKSYYDAGNNMWFTVPPGAAYTLTFGIKNLRPNGDVRSHVCMVYEGVNPL